jgi:photosystem II stability/assembly factor-like uncharacterized protein
MLMKTSLARQIRMILAISLLLFMTTANSSPAIGEANSGSSDPGEWKPLLGPTYPGGMVDDLAISQSDSDQLYALLQGINGERLYHSPDETLTWQQVYTFSVPVDEIALDPGDPAKLYAGGSGILLRSSNGGISWTQVYTLGEVVEVISPTLVIAGGQIAPADNTCYSGYRGLARSQDGGDTWQRTYSGCFDALTLIVPQPGDPQVIYVGGTINEVLPMLLRCTNEERACESLLTYQPFGGSTMRSLVIDAQNPTRMYASNDSMPFYSTDGGKTWNLNYQLPFDPLRFLQSGNSLYAFPANEYQDLKVYRSDNGGDNWWASQKELPSYTRVLAADPLNAGVLYAGMNGYGIYRSPDQANTWQERNAGLRSLAPVNALAVSPAEADLIYAGSDGPRGGLFQSRDGGVSWRTVISDTPILAAAVNPITPTLAYAGGLNDIYQTTDGEHWQIFYPEATIHAVAATTQADIAYAAGAKEIQPYPTYPYSYGFVARYVPGDQELYPSWYQQKITGTLSIDSVAVHPSDPLVVYAGGISVDKNKEGAIFRSRDGGKTWQQIFETLVGGITQIAIDPTNPKRLYAATFDRVYRSLDGGDTWAEMKALNLNLGFGYPTRGLVVDDLGELWAGYTLGIYRWQDGMGDWTLDGLPDLYTRALAFQPQPRRMLAGNEDGVWMRDLPPVVRAWLPRLGK